MTVFTRTTAITAFHKCMLLHALQVLSELRQRFHRIRLLRQRQRLQQLYAMNGCVHMQLIQRSVENLL
jgi:hypothetical protein